MPRTTGDRGSAIILRLTTAALVIGAAAVVVSTRGGGAPPSPASSAAPASAAAQPSGGTKPSPVPPGTYRYQALGHSMVSTTGVKSADGDGSVTVEPAQGDRQHVVRRQPGMTVDAVLSYRPEGVYLVDFRLEHEAFTKQFHSDTGVAVLPTTMTPTWDWALTSTDGATTLTATFSWFRSETRDVRGTSVQTVALRVVMSLAGDMKATITQTLWQAADSGKLVELREGGDGTVGTTRFRFDRRVVLQEADPS